MTTNPLLATLIPLVADLSRDLPEDERYRRLLQALRDLLPCDATALLRLDGEYLIRWRWTASARTPSAGASGSANIRASRPSWSAAG